MEERHSKYLEILRKMRQSNGDIGEGETQIVTDPETVAVHEKKLQRSFVEKGMPKSFGDVGVIGENPWYITMNEPVLFPSKNGPIPGAYFRVLYKGDIGGQSSVFCLPVLESGEFLLAISYRTTVRDWVIEGPGTVTLTGESHEDAIKRCVQEKLGRDLLSTQELSLGGIISERGIMGASVPVYLAKVSELETKKPSDLNVRGVKKMTFNDLRQGFVNGFVETHGHKCVCRDGYTAFAILMMMFRGFE